MLLPCFTELFPMEPQDALFRGGVDPDGPKETAISDRESRARLEKPATGSSPIAKEEHGCIFFMGPPPKQTCGFPFGVSSPKTSALQNRQLFEDSGDVRMAGHGAPQSIFFRSIDFGHRPGDSRSSKRPPGPDGFGSGGSGAGAHEVRGGEKRRRAFGSGHSRCLDCSELLATALARKREAEAKN